MIHLAFAAALLSARPAFADEKLNVCVVLNGDDKGAEAFFADLFRKHSHGAYSSLRATSDSSDIGDCDAVIYEGATHMGFFHGRREIKITSGRSRQVVARSPEEGWEDEEEQSARLLQPGGDAYNKIMAERQAAAAPPIPPQPVYQQPVYQQQPVMVPSAAPAVTQADLQRIAEEAARKASEATAKSQPKAVTPEELAQALKAQEAAKQPAAIASDVDAPKYPDAARPDDVALVIGVEKYNDLPDAQFAERDATAVRDHLLALGFAPRNVVLLTGSRASRAGIATSLKKRLPVLVKPSSEVFFYYSGHGSPDPKTGQVFLVPSDGDPSYLDETAYPLARVYSELGALKAKRVLVALDACFSGAGGRSVVPKGTRPLVTVKENVEPESLKNLTTLTASHGNEISGPLAEQGHGVFTYYFLKGLLNGRRSFKQLYDYVKPNVEDAARLQNRDQSPVLTGPDASL